MDELQRQLRAFSKAYGQKGKAIVERIQQLMDGGMTVTQAVQQAFQEYDVADWLDANVSQAIVSTAQDALGAELAGALSSAELLKALSTPWDGSGMTLSQKLHGASREMRQSIVETVQNQIRRNSTIQKAAQALYDGYGYGHVTRTQELPKYLNGLTRWVRSSRESMTPADQLSVLKAIRKVKAQADGLADDRVTYNHFRTSLKELLAKVESGSDKAARKALQVAVEEKSRYVAERIARTEAARARYDAFIARYDEDDSVVAYKWTLSSRHPVDDICNMYAEADLYGLGKGIFPKDAAPVNPAHPHCLCHYAPVYSSELKGLKRSDDVEDRGNTWLKKQPLRIQEKILGVKGREAWKAGKAGWLEKARNFGLSGKKESRLSDLQSYKKPNYGKEIREIHYKNDLFLTLKEVTNSNYKVYVSTDVQLKPKMLHEMETQISESVRLMGISDLSHFPRFIIMSDKESAGAWGNYSAKMNSLYINADSLKRKQYVSALRQSSKKGIQVSSTSHLSTMVHELFHWLDAERYIAQNGAIQNQREYIAKIDSYFQKKVDHLINSGYNIDGISSYAKRSMAFGSYAEVMTEYRTKELLGGR